MDSKRFFSFVNQLTFAPIAQKFKSSLTPCLNFTPVISKQHNLTTHGLDLGNQNIQSDETDLEIEKVNIQKVNKKLHELADDFSFIKTTHVVN